MISSDAESVWYANEMHAENGSVYWTQISQHSSNKDEFIIKEGVKFSFL